MDGVIVSTSTPLQRLAAYVKSRLPAAGYHIEEGRRTGDNQRFVRDMQAAVERLGGDVEAMDRGMLTRLLKAERMPGPRTLLPLATALGVDYRELLVEAGIIPPELVAESDNPPVRSRLTPDEVAASWGITDAEGIARVRAMYDELTVKPVDTPAASTGDAEAQG